MQIQENSLSMSLLTFGINHKTAPIDIREKVAFGPEVMPKALKMLVKVPKVKEAAILSTCNRTEVYCETENTKANAVSNWFGDFHRLDQAEIKPYSYVLPDQGSIRHILRVASGLDSLILGEPQILGQMKDAYHKASKAGCIGKVLNRLFQHTFRVAKQIRTDTTIGSSPVSVAFAAVSLAKRIFADISDKTVLLVGAGETIELVARHLVENKIAKVIVANRSLDKAHHLAKEYGGYAISLTEIAEHLPEADVLISSTASPLPIIGKGTVESALKKRKHKPVFMVDLAVPRDIEPEVAELDDAYLYTVDDLQDVISENMQNRKEASKQAEEIIDIQTSHFWDWILAQKNVSIIKSLRHQAEQSKQQSLNQAYKMLERGHNPQEVLKVMAHQLTNRITHKPCSVLRNSTDHNQQELLTAARTLFGTDETLTD